MKLIVTSDIYMYNLLSFIKFGVKAIKFCELWEINFGINIFIWKKIKNKQNIMNIISLWAFFIGGRRVGRITISLMNEWFFYFYYLSKVCISISLISKVFCHWIRYLGFKSHLHHKLLGNLMIKAIIIKWTS